MSEKLVSRKLGAFVFTVLLIIANYIFVLGLPIQAVLYLVVLTSSYILGQGYVDGKQQPVKELPVADITDALANIVQAELVKTTVGKELPLEEIMTMFKGILSAEMAKINTFTIAPTPVVIPDVVPIDSQVTGQ